MPTRPNILLLGADLYLVRTQAGFRKALKLFLIEHGGLYDKPRDVNGYPKSYPSVVSLSFENGSGRFLAHCKSVDKYRQLLQALLAKLEDD